MKCEKCGCFVFKIQTIGCCGDCSENAAWESNEAGYQYDNKVVDEKGLIRDHVENEGECSYGSAFGGGCYMFICFKCNHKTNLPVSDSC